MARGIRPLGPEQLVFPVQDAEFSPLVADTLGENITDADGFETMLADAARALDLETDELGNLALDLLGSEFIPGELEETAITPLLQDHAAFVQSGDTLLSDMAGAIADDPSQPPPQGDGGGEQGGGGGGGDEGGPQPGGQSCATSDQPGCIAVAESLPARILRG